MSKLNPKERLWKRMEKEYVEGEDLVTYSWLAAKYSYTDTTVARHGANGGWAEGRRIYRMQKQSAILDKKEERNTRIDDLFDKTAAEIKSLELLDTLLDLLTNPKEIKAMQTKMQFKDYKDLIILAAKIREGVGYADKVTVIKAPSMEQLRETYAYKLGYNEAICEHKKHLPKNVVNAQFSVIADIPEID